MDHGQHGIAIKGMVRAASVRVDEHSSTKSGKVVAIREDWENKAFARIEIEYANGKGSGGGEAPTLTDTVTIPRKQSKMLSLGDRIGVVTTVKKLG